MTARSPFARHGLLVRWLRGAWLGWVALVLLLLVMTQVVKPRVGEFMDYWYSVPADSAFVEQAAVLRQTREQQAIQSAWITGAAPVALLFLMQLLVAVFARGEELDEEDGEEEAACRVVDAEPRAVVCAA